MQRQQNKNRHLERHGVVVIQKFSHISREQDHRLPRLYKEYAGPRERRDTYNNINWWSFIVTRFIANGLHKIKLCLVLQNQLSNWREHCLNSYASKIISNSIVTLPMAYIFFLLRQVLHINGSILKNLHFVMAIASCEGPCMHCSIDNWNGGFLIVLRVTFSVNWVSLWRDLERSRMWRVIVDCVMNF